MTMNLPCPSCGAAVTVRSAALPYVTCMYCQTLIRRDDAAFTEIGKTAILPFDVSPIQIGTHGSWHTFQFTVVGRVRWGWSDGSWNEWFLDCSDGTARWLAEAMGSYMLTAQYSADFEMPGQRGVQIILDGHTFTASDVKIAQCLGSDGELPLSTLVGTSMTSVDFRSGSNVALSVQQSDAQVRGWLGHNMELAELKPGNLRDIEGWNLPPRTLA